MRVPVTDPSMRQFVLELPWTEFTNMKKTKKDGLNLNLYRNLYYRALSAQKNNFHERISKLIKDMGIPPLGTVWLHYEIHPSNLGRVDTMNVGSVVDKFFSDTLTKTGVIEDDDYTRVVFNSFCFGYVAKNAPFVKVTITELEPRKKENMRLLLDEDDIQAALESWVESQNYPNATGVKLSAENGQLTAEVLFGGQKSRPVNTDEEDDQPKPKSRGGRPKGSTNKPKEEVTDVGTSDQGSRGRDAEGTGEASGGASNSDDDDFLTGPKTGGGSKNPSQDSQGESSNDREDDPVEEAKTVSGEESVKRKPASIFDDD